MNRPKVAFVVEQMVGHVAYYQNLRSAEAEAKSIEPTWVPIEYTHTPFPWAVTGSWKARKAIGRLEGKVQGLVVHTQVIALMSGDQFRRTPTVITTDHTAIGNRRIGYPILRRGAIAERVKLAAYRRAFREAVGVVSWSEWVKRSLIEDYGCPEASVAVIPPGVDLEAFRPAPRQGGRPKVLFVGRDFERKGGDLLLRVFGEGLHELADLILVTAPGVADGTEAQVLSDLRPNSAELRRLFAECDLFVFPTRADTLGIVCIEAIASGLPVVSTGVGGVPEVIRDGETGLLVPPDDERALMTAIKSFLDSPERRRRFGDAGRRDAEKRFDVRKNSRRLFDHVGHCLFRTSRCDDTRVDSP